MIMAHPKLVGRENLRDVDGPLLISCNHVTYIDVGFALLALPPRLRRKLAVGMWGELLWEMWRPPGFVESGSCACPTKWDTTLSSRCSTFFPCRSSRECARASPMPANRSTAATACWSIPKACGRPTASRRPFRSGLGILAARLNIPVLPLRIDGLYEMKMAGHKIARPGQLKVVIGKPLRFPSETPPEEITNQLEHVTWTM